MAKDRILVFIGPKWWAPRFIRCATPVAQAVWVLFGDEGAQAFVRSVGRFIAKYGTRYEVIG